MNTVTWSSESGIARLTFDQPDGKVNALSRSVWAELAAAVAAIRDTTGIRGLIVRSAKPGIFLAGADLRELAGLPTDDPTPTQELVRVGHEVLFALEQVPFPTAAVIDGACLGGGLEVALACDARFVGTHPKVKLGLPEVKLGLIPGWGGTQRLPRLIDPAAALQLLVTGESVDGPRAVELGLADRVAESEQVEKVAVEWLTTAEVTEGRMRRQRPRPLTGPLHELQKSIAELPEAERVAAAAAVQVVALGLAVPLPAAVRVEAAAFLPLLASGPARERIHGFLQRS